MSSSLSLRMEETPRYENAPVLTPYRLSTIRHFYPLISGRVAYDPQMLDRGDELRGNLSPTASIVQAYQPAGSINIRPYLNTLVPVLDLSGLVMTGTEGDGVNEVHTITASGTVSGGTYDYTLTDTDITLAITGIPYNATAVQVQRLIDQRIMTGGTGLELGDLVVAGGPLPTTPMTITFEGTQAARNVAVAVVEDAALTGSTPVYAIAATTAGSVGTVLLPDGRGIPVGAWRWDSAKRTGATAKTAEVTAAYDEHDAWDIGQGYGASQLSMGSDGTLTATMLGLVARPGLDPSLSPTYDHPDVHPMLGRDVIVTWKSEAGNIADFSWQIANPIEATPHRGIRSAFPGKMRYANGFVTMTGSVTMDEYDTDDRTDFLTGQTFPVTAHHQSRSKVGATGARYEMFNELPALQITGGAGADELAARRRFGAAYDWLASYDPDEAADFTLTLVTGLTAVEAFS